MADHNDDEHAMSNAASASWIHRTPIVAIECAHAAFTISILSIFYLLSSLLYLISHKTIQFGFEPWCPKITFLEMTR